MPDGTVFSAGPIRIKGFAGSHSGLMDRFGTGHTNRTSGNTLSSRSSRDCGPGPFGTGFAVPGIVRGDACCPCPGFPAFSAAVIAVVRGLAACGGNTREPEIFWNISQVPARLSRGSPRVPTGRTSRTTGNPAGQSVPAVDDRYRRRCHRPILTVVTCKTDTTKERLRACTVSGIDTRDTAFSAHRGFVNARCNPDGWTVFTCGTAVPRAHTSHTCHITRDRRRAESIQPFADKRVRDFTVFHLSRVHRRRQNQTSNCVYCYTYCSSCLINDPLYCVPCLTLCGKGGSAKRRGTCVA